MAKIKLCRKNIRFFSIFLFFLFRSIFASADQSIQIDYYGVVSQNADSAMVKMAEDMFFTHLKSLESVNIFDFTEVLKSSGEIAAERLLNDESDFFGTTASGHIVFFIEISETLETENKKWICTLKAKNSRDGIFFSQSSNYESFYKILTNAKKSIENMISFFAESEFEGENLPRKNFEQKISTESLAGTWSGEEGIAKIVILRGGRGFVIFKNGASMNISVKIEDSNEGQIAKIAQVGKSNASFFPEISREEALKAAPTAPPITWTLKISDESTLSGTKKTFVFTEGSTKFGEFNVTWKKRT